MRIAFLGWGSLLWDVRPEFASTHGPWHPDGPTLPIEFSRISVSRGRALTLVIDHDCGSDCVVAFAFSSRESSDDAVADLRCREGTTLGNIGYCFSNELRHRSSSDQTLGVVRQWATTKQIDLVVWTDLTSNFASKSTGKAPFSVPNAISHLQLLPIEARAGAAEYIWRAPSFVDTPLRRAVQIAPWFNTDG